jgi:hypothetical protein
MLVSQESAQPKSILRIATDSLPRSRPTGPTRLTTVSVISKTMSPSLWPTFRSCAASSHAGYSTSRPSLRPWSVSFGVNGNGAIRTHLRSPTFQVVSGDFSTRSYLALRMTSLPRSPVRATLSTQRSKGTSDLRFYERKVGLPDRDPTSRAAETVLIDTKRPIVLRRATF